MEMKGDTFIGGSFDEFLREEGVLEEVERVAVKRVLAYQIAELMKQKSISKSEMAQLMKTSRSALERLLDPENNSVTLVTMERAAHVLGKELRLVLA
jgi:antitoxin HicB